MNDINSLAHSKWNCKYHIVFAPKYKIDDYHYITAVEVKDIIEDTSLMGENLF